MTTYAAVQDPAADTLMSLEVCSRTALTEDIARFELAHPDGGELPAFSAGAHVLVVTPEGFERRYSLCNAPGERHRYVIAVKREAAGRGGSAWMMEALRPGMRLEVSSPLNYFPLCDSASSHLLVAGGIGITPILAMAHELAAHGAEFRLVYCTRSPAATAFRGELLACPWRDRIEFHHDGGEPPATLPFAARLANREGEAHLYCCGPRALMKAVREAASHWPSRSLHFEDFGAEDPAPGSGADDAFAVRLARSGRTITVPAGVSILEALRRAGIEVPSSCESGTCGTCRTGLVAGDVEHRDFVLDEDEQREHIMICVSRGRSREIVLDL